ncbi:hypothetical protein GGX14DRAFT_407654 [Mycena pura]|uniref:Uncharacterized protein n=1 Tax=Mycena pura TaxID=153505 RepID=A0AAD6Y099_9AGAR|nr:hypothetical protein GGX14DRAFT_407654 [Mycena pura]
MRNLVDGDPNNSTTSLSPNSNTPSRYNLALSSDPIDSTMSSLNPPVEVAQVSSNISTFMIHSPKSHKTSHVQNSAALCEEDIRTLNDYPAGGAMTSVHSPDAAVFWLEANFDLSLLRSIQTNGLGGPIAAMLSPEEPTLVIFGSILDDKVLKIAQQLAEISKFPVMVRPLRDNPITRWKSQSNEERSPDGHEGNFEDQSWTNEDFSDEDSRPDSTDFEEENLCPESEDLAKDDQDSDAIIASISEHVQSPQSQGEVSFGKAWRLRGGALDSLWKSRWHGVDVCLKISRPSHEDKVHILTKIQTIENQFTVQRDNEDQPQVVCHIKFKVDPKSTSSIESDRSYSNIGFLVKGLLINDIEERPFAEFVPPQQTQKAVHTSSHQVTLSSNFTSPNSGGIGVSVTRGGTEAKEQQNDRPTPKCTVYYHSGEPFEVPGCSCDSINVACVAENVLTNREEQNVKHPMRVEYSAGIYVVNEEDPNKWDSEETETSFLIRNQTNLWIPSSSLKAGGQGIAYIPDVETTDRMYVRDTPEVKLVNNTQIPPANTAPDLYNSSIKRAVFISAAFIPKPQPLGRFKEAAKKIPKFFGIGTQNPRIIPGLYLHEYVARGWDVQWNEWRMPVYPTLTAQLQAVHKTDIAYELTIPARESRNIGHLIAATISSDSEASGTKSDSLSTPNPGTVGTSFTSLTASTKSGDANENAVAGPSKTRI